jgi:tetratricopeptide (TPR) repeat protein
MFRPRPLNRCESILFFLLSPAPALASAPDCTKQPLCRDHFDRGVSFDSEGKYEPALREFHAAYQNQKDPRIAAHIGRAQHKLGRFSDALSSYKEAERAAPGDADLQQKLHEYIAQANQSLAANSGQTPTITRVEAKSGPAHAEATVHNNIQVNPQVTVSPQITVSPLLPVNVTIPTPVQPTGTQSSLLQRTEVYKRPWLWLGLSVLTAGAVGLGVGLAAREPNIDGYENYRLALTNQGGR